MRGKFTFFAETPKQIIIPNTIVDEGEESFVKMLMQGAVADVALGGNFYLGLCSETPGETDTLASITTEPSSAGGYARQAVTRDAIGFPTVDQVGGVFRAVSQLVTFAATGADFSTSVTRAFLCNVASGTAGKLFAYSGPLAAAVTVLDGETLPMRYELYLD